MRLFLYLCRHETLLLDRVIDFAGFGGLTVSQAEYWMGKMLYDEGLEQEALNTFIVSERYIGNHNADRAIIENSKAVVFILIGQHDNANYASDKVFFTPKKDILIG